MKILLKRSMMINVGCFMRTTLSIDDDILLAAKDLAARQNKTIGEVISNLSRQALQPVQAHIAMRNGIPLLPVRSDSVPITLELVNRLRDESLA
jgi:hypothetical protein